MRATELTSVLARLLSEPTLRAAFRRDAADLADQLGLQGAERDVFLTLDANQLEAQAEALIAKRLHEVEALRPDLFRAQPAERRARFRRYAEGYWPTGHRRHHQDATQFARYLLESPADLEPVERHRLQFLSSRRRFALHFVGAARCSVGRRSALHLLLRRGDAWREWLIYLGLR